MQFSGGSAVLCVPGALYTQLSGACLMAKCVCAQGAGPGSVSALGSCSCISNDGGNTSGTLGDEPFGGDN